MSEGDIKKNLSNGDNWLRLLFVILFGLIFQLASMVLGLVILLQFISVLFTSKRNDNLLKLGMGLTAYIKQILQYATFAQHHKPFPFSDWPEVAVEDAAPFTSGDDDEPIITPKSDDADSDDSETEDETAEEAPAQPATKKKTTKKKTTKKKTKKKTAKKTSKKS